MPFFIRKGKKRNHQLQTSRLNNKRQHLQPSKTKKNDEIIEESDIETDSDNAASGTYSDDDQNDGLTAQETKVKLAKKYLNEVEEEERERLLNDGDCNVEKSVLKRLTEDELKKAGRLKRNVADHVKLLIDQMSQMKFKRHKLTITSVVISSDSLYVYSASKDSSIVKWSLETGDKISSIRAKLGKKNKKNQAAGDSHLHSSAINCLAISQNNKFLVSGDQKGLINVWNPVDLSFLTTFKGHKKAITGLAICRDTNYLYSSSHDSLVKVWTLNEFAYTETLFGHQSNITSVDMLYKERVITSGGSDCTIRIWKIQEESQLVYNGHPGETIDMVKRIDNAHFVSAGDHGIISIWSVLKKKPLCSVHNAHGISEENGRPNWISSICAFPSSDLIVSGSCDGYVRLWKCSTNYSSLTMLSSIEIPGFVNSIVFSPSEKYLLIAASKEHRFGRWFSLKTAKNLVFRLPIEISE